MKSLFQEDLNILDSTTEEKKEITLIIGVVVAGVLVILITIVIAIFVIRWEER